MTQLVRLAALVAILALPTAIFSQTSGVREQAVRAAVDEYFQGHATGDGSHYAKVFHADAKVFWIGADGRVMQRTAADYIKGALGKPAADEAKRRRRIVSVDITGNTAMVKGERDHPSTRFTDYFSLVESGGAWLIVNKTVVAEPK